MHIISTSTPFLPVRHHRASQPQSLAQLARLDALALGVKVSSHAEEEKGQEGPERRVAGER